MNKNQKEAEKAKLKDEKKVLETLKEQYKRAAEDVEGKLRIHSDKIDFILNEYDELDDDMKSILQSQIYQQQFQKQIKTQLDEIIEKMNDNQYETIQEYLEDCYTTSFVGTAFDLHGQGIPLIMPIDQRSMVDAVTLDPKLSAKLYGGYMEQMKTNVAAEISRGIAMADSFENIARNISNRTNQSFNNTMRIVRTEGHAIQIRAAVNMQELAKKAGADVLKQWDSTLDARTRDSHARLDGEIRELDEKFSNGMKYPSDPAGGAAEVINCRCALLQRAKWALDEEELEVLKQRAEYYGLDKTEDLKEFAKKYNIAWKEELALEGIRNLPEIEFDMTIKGLNTAKTGAKIEKIGDAEFNVTLPNRETVDWDDISKDLQNRIRFSAPKRTSKPFAIEKGTYNVQPYVSGSTDRIKREEIGKSIGGKYVGTTWYSKYGTIWEVDFYQKDGEIIYSLGLADVKKTLTKKSLASVIKVAEEREKLIGKRLQKKNIPFSRLKQREGNDWVDSMKEFHKTIGADASPTIVSKAEYDAVKSPILYRGIAPSSHLRKDIKTNLTTQEMADGFFKDSMPFPSRGIYGDGVAYCSPSLENIGGKYASSGGSITRGGKIIEFKIKEDAKVISYEDAVAIFENVAGETSSNLLFSKNQRKTEHEVGKAMNALGYDVIIKENGDNTGVPFYVILNRGALIAKEDWTTVTVTPEWLRKAKQLW